MTQPTRPMGLFITGTDTGVGKTHVTCLIAGQLIRQGIHVAAYKPVCSGAVLNETDAAYHWDDIDRIKAVIGNRWSDTEICPQRFLAPLAPPVAARLEGKCVDFQQLVNGVQSFADQHLVLIEGAGGWLSPVTETQTVADLAQALNYPVLIVARTGLGTINHTLLTIESILARNLKTAGVILNEAVSVKNDPSCETNRDEIERRSGVPVLGTVPFDNSERFEQRQRVRVDWLSLAGG